jgi:hypothetical protein
MNSQSTSAQGDDRCGTAPPLGAPVRSFDPSALPDPPADWSYWLDETEVVYGPGPWPFYWSKPATVRFKREVVRKHRRLLRLVPSWMFGECEYPRLATLLLGPAARSAFVTFDVFVRAVPDGGILERVDATVSFPDLAWCWPRELSEDIRAQAECKREKVLAFLRDAIDERDRGVPMPIVASDRGRALNAARRRK